MAHLSKSHQLNNSICIIPIVLQIYKKPDSSIEVIVQEPKTSREDAKIENRSVRDENETLTCLNCSKELNKENHRNEERLGKSQDHEVLKNEDKTKYLCKPLEEEYHPSKSTIKGSADGVQSEENYKQLVEYPTKQICTSNEGGSSESDSELNIKSYKDCSTISFDKLTLTSAACLDNTDLQASQDSAYKSSTDLFNDEDSRHHEGKSQNCEQILSLTDGSSIKIETNGNNVILSKIKLEEINNHKTENASLNWVTEFYDTEMQPLHQKLKELKYHIHESKCPSMKCRRKLEHLTKQMLNDEGHQLDFILNRDKITSNMEHLWKIDEITIDLVLIEESMIQSQASIYNQRCSLNQYPHKAQQIYPNYKMKGEQEQHKKNYMFNTQTTRECGDLGNDNYVSMIIGTELDDALEELFMFECNCDSVNDETLQSVNTNTDESLDRMISDYLSNETSNYTKEFLEMRLNECLNKKKSESIFDKHHQIPLESHTADVYKKISMTSLSPCKKLAFENERCTDVLHKLSMTSISPHKENLGIKECDNSPKCDVLKTENHMNICVYEESCTILCQKCPRNPSKLATYQSDKTLMRNEPNINNEIDQNEYLEDPYSNFENENVLEIRRLIKMLNDLDLDEIDLPNDETGDMKALPDIDISGDKINENIFNNTSNNRINTCLEQMYTSDIFQGVCFLLVHWFIKKTFLRCIKVI